MDSAEIKSLWIGDKVFVRSRGANGIFEGEVSPGIVKVSFDSEMKHYDAADIFEYKPEREAKAKTVKEEPIEQGIDLLAIANFNRKLDLHIEVLNASYKGKPAGEILQYQVQAAESFIKKALNIQIDKVYLIHGKGTGVLKDTLLDAVPGFHGVESCKVCDNPLYGDDALEVILDV